MNLLLQTGYLPRKSKPSNPTAYFTSTLILKTEPIYYMEKYLGISQLIPVYPLVHFVIFMRISLKS